MIIFQAAMTPARDIEAGVMRRLRLTRLRTVPRQRSCGRACCWPTKG